MTVPELLFCVQYWNTHPGWFLVFVTTVITPAFRVRHAQILAGKTAGLSQPYSLLNGCEILVDWAFFVWVGLIL